MAEKTNKIDSPIVDKGLVDMFLRMSVEERIQANSHAVQAILELRDAGKKKKSIETVEEQTSILKEVLKKEVKQHQIFSFSIFRIFNLSCFRDKNILSKLPCTGVQF